MLTNRPMLAVLALALFAIMASAAWIGLSSLEHPERIGRSGS